MEVYELMQIWFERIPCLKLLLRACLILFDFSFCQRKCSCVQRPLFVTVSGLVVLLVNVVGFLVIVQRNYPHLKIWVALILMNPA